MRQSQTNTRQFSLFQIVALGLALLAIVISIIGASSDVDRFFQIYLVGFLFLLQIALGCLGLVLLLNIVGGRWGFALWRIAAAGARTLPLLGLMFIPLLFGLDRVYAWTAEGIELEGGKAFYLQTGFFIIRAVIYFVIWIVLSYLLTQWSYEHDKSGNQELVNRSVPVSVIGMILYFFTCTFAAFDWAMSLDPDWFSTIFGWLFMSQQVLAGMGFLILALSFFWDREPLKAVVNERAFGDIGALLLVALMVWIYLSFIQYVVIWSGNLPKKGLWYVQRTSGGWEGYILFVTLFHILPLILLLIPGLKRIRSVILTIAALLLILRFVDLYWVVMPSFLPEFNLQWWDFVLPVGLGALWVLFFEWLLSQHALLPTNHPELEKTMTYRKEDMYEPA